MSGFVSPGFRSVGFRDIGSSPAGEPQPVPGAIAIYRFDEGAGQILHDYSGNGNHGTLGSTTGVDTNDPTWNEKGLVFGGDDFVNCGNPVALQTMNPYTVITAFNLAAGLTATGSFISKKLNVPETPGSGDGQFNISTNVAVDSTGTIYVADTGNRRIQKFTSTGTFIMKWGSLGSGDGQFNYPTGIAVDGVGNIYVADTYNNRVQKFDQNGTFITQWGNSGTADGQFRYPQGIAADSSGIIYVADSDNHRIQKFTSTGTFIMKWGSLGSGDGQFIYPVGITVDSVGYVYVADSGNHRIQKFTSNGTFIKQWGSLGSGDGQFNYPYGIAVDGTGAVYVADYYNNRVQKFDQNGTFITMWGQPPGQGFDINFGLRAVRLFHTDSDAHLKIAQIPFAPDSQWHLLIARYTGLGIKIQLDDTESAVVPCGYLPAASQPLTMGKLSSAATYFLTGSKTKSDIYPFALSDSQVAQEITRLKYELNKKGIVLP